MLTAHNKPPLDVMLHIILHADACCNTDPQDCAKNWTVDAVRMLLDAGADPSLCDDAGFTALLVANCNDEIKPSESKQGAGEEVANLLLKAGAGTCTVCSRIHYVSSFVSKKYVTAPPQFGGPQAARQGGGVHTIHSSIMCHMFHTVPCAHY